MGNSLYICFFKLKVIYMGFSILILLIHTYFRFLKRAPAFFFIILFEHSTFLFHMQRKGLVLRHLIMDMLIPPYIRS